MHKKVLKREAIIDENKDLHAKELKKLQK